MTGREISTTDKTHLKHPIINGRKKEERAFNPLHTMSRSRDCFPQPDFKSIACDTLRKHPKDRKAEKERTKEKE